jgi:hypothetical protein
VDPTFEVDQTDQTQDKQVTEQQEIIPVHRSARVAKCITLPKRYLLLTKIQEVANKLVEGKEQAKFIAIQKEVLQVFYELKALMPVVKTDIPKDAEIFRCFIFLVETFFVNGEFNKIKARCYFHLFCISRI